MNRYINWKNFRIIAFMILSLPSIALAVLAIISLLMFGSWFKTLVFIGCALTISPSFGRFFKRKYIIKVSRWLQFMAVIVGLVTMVALSGAYHDKIEQEATVALVKQRRIQHVAQFKDQRSQILIDLQGVTNSGKFDEVMSNASKFLDIADAEYLVAYNTANVLYQKIVAQKTAAQAKEQAERDRVRRKADQIANANAGKPAALEAVKASIQFIEFGENDLKSGVMQDEQSSNFDAYLNNIDGMANSLNNARLLGAVWSKEELAFLRSTDRRLAAFQQRAFPVLRRVFVKRTAKAMWLQNALAQPDGSTIRFTAGMFASNANIQIFETEIEKLLSRLRYKKSCYEWYKGSGGSCYTLHTPPDGTISLYVEGQFQKMAPPI